MKEFGSTWISHGELMGLNKETLQNLEKGHDAMYPVPEARIWELFKEAGFKNVRRFYSVLIYCGWIVTK